MHNLWIDIRFGFRQLWKSPGFAITAVLTLGLGIAAAIAIFGFVDAALIRPIPYPHPSGLMGVFETSPLSGPRCGYSYPNYLDLERFNNVFASIAAYNGDKNFALSNAGSIESVKGIGVTGSFFRILGVNPVLGKDFAADPDSENLLAAPATVILSYAAWQNRFGGRSDVLGKSVTLNGDSYSVIGVLPKTFQFAPAGGTEFWTTLRPFAGDDCAVHRGCMVMGVIARLGRGIALHQALAAVKAIAAQEARQHPDPDRNRGANVVPLSEVILGDIQPILLALLAGAALLLLIAYVNVTGLLLVRSESRKREFAVRGALGAPRGRLLRQFVAEGLVLVALSSGIGFLGTTLTRNLILKLVSLDMLDSMPYLRDAGWNWHMTAFATALLLIACGLFSITPALRLSSAGLRDGLAESARAAGTTWRRLGARLVVLELAMTMVLLAGAGLLGKSFFLLMKVEVGFIPRHLATLHVIAPEVPYAKDEQAVALQKAIVDRLLNLPGVTAVGTANNLPVSGNSLTQIGFVGSASLGENNEVGHRTMSPEYLSALQAQLLRGRHFDENDNLGRPLVAIVNQTLARRYFPDQNPLGKRVFWHGRPQMPIQIVGVIADVREVALDAVATPFIYTPFDQGPSPDFSLAVRTSQEPASVFPSLVAAIHTIDPGILTSDPATMPEVIQGSSAAYLHRASAWLASGFAALALLLSIVGLYGVVAYSVSQRTREIGIRMALGARPGSVYQLILNEAGRLTLRGLAIGLLSSVAAGMFMRSLLFGVRSWDVSILSAVAALLIGCALLASYLPARRAASVNPLEALRTD